ncbi:MAG: GNAT family N-acetyltransferase [Acidobacteria bacterium]|nr:GNAT family N-acetyltransferase [Acidobacteriota bacterium]
MHTVVMAGFIRDNGMASPLNRGDFYGCRDEEGRLVGVALIGHATLVETDSDEALAAFARAARECPRTHVMMGERDRIERFWEHYAEDGRSPRLICRELLMEQRWPIRVREEVPNLRLATPADLDQVMAVQAQMAFDESGVNPLESDPEGFRLRCLRRIDQCRVWVWTEEGRLIFKADIISETPEVKYVEGVWVAPDQRGRGYGLRCLSQLSRELLAGSSAVTLLVNEKARGAVSFYRRAGYKLRSQYDTIFLHTGR